MWIISTYFCHLYPVSCFITGKLSENESLPLFKCLLRSFLSMVWGDLDYSWFSQCTETHWGTFTHITAHTDTTEALLKQKKACLLCNNSLGHPHTHVPFPSECMKPTKDKVSKDNLVPDNRYCECVCVVYTGGLGAPVTSEGPDLTKKTSTWTFKPLRGIDYILSYFDTTDSWCAICIIVHFMMF